MEAADGEGGRPAELQRPRLWDAFPACPRPGSSPTLHPGLPLWGSNLSAVHLSCRCWL